MYSLSIDLWKRWRGTPTSLSKSSRIEVLQGSDQGLTTTTPVSDRELGLELGLRRSQSMKPCSFEHNMKTVTAWASTFYNWYHRWISQITAGSVCIRDQKVLDMSGHNRIRSIDAVETSMSGPKSSRTIQINMMPSLSDKPSWRHCSLHRRQ